PSPYTTLFRSWGDAGGEQLVHQARVVVQTGLVDSPPVRDHPRPGGREPVGIQAEVADECDVLAIPVVLVTGDRPVLATAHGTRYPAEGVPDGVPPAVLGGSSFHLVGGGGHAPLESAGESHRAGRGGR